MTHRRVLPSRKAGGEQQLLVREVAESRDWKEWEAPETQAQLATRVGILYLSQCLAFQGQKAFCVDLKTVDLLLVFDCWSSNCWPDFHFWHLLQRYSIL